MTDILMQYSNILFLLLGIFIGYALSRKQQDKPIIDIKRSPGPVVEDFLADPFNRAQFTEEELTEQKRIPTIME